jgi:hypothetical protein
VPARAIVEVGRCSLSSRISAMAHRDPFGPLVTPYANELSDSFRDRVQRVVGFVVKQDFV